MILPAAPPLFRAGDSELRYRPDSELFYLTGFREPESVLLLRGFADEARSILFVRPRDRDAELWTGTRVGPEGAVALVGVDEARPLDELDNALPGLVKGADRIYLRLGLHPRIERSVVAALREARLKGSRTGSGPRAVLDPGELLDEFRLRKDPQEIEAMRTAAAITVAGFEKGLGHVRSGAGEWEIEAEVEGEFRRRGALGPSFGTIVGSGANACVLHYTENDRRMEAGELVLLDAGAEWRMYSGDITRTVPVSGRFSPRQREIYEVVESARQAAVDAVAPGLRTDELHLAAVGAIVRGLLDLGVLSGSFDELLEAKAHEAYFPHRTSHWLGLNTHDPGDYARGGTPRPLEPGMVLTVEPGLYFPPDGDSPYAGIGIRIEDDVLVTPDGGENLTESLPTEPADVEALVGALEREAVDVRG
jgi:Xaa-Pro aminopeptidase